MSLQEAASQVGRTSQIGRRATKFCPANVQKIKDFVAQGISRHEIAELLDVPLGLFKSHALGWASVCGDDMFKAALKRYDAPTLQIIRR